MNGMNKFKVLTVVIVCTFLFVVGAIYSNTKDVTATKLKEKAQEEQVQENAQEQSQNAAHNEVAGHLESSNQALQDQIDFLTKRMDEMSSSTNSSDLNCRIEGTLSSSGLEQLSPDEAVQDARENQNELVVLCSFK